jgi:two-component system sensor histidine kinase SenX3
MSFLALAHPLARWSSLEVYGAAAGIAVVSFLLGVAIWRHRGLRSVAQRLDALGHRLGDGAERDSGKVEDSLAYLEAMTTEASTHVNESSADVTRLRRSLDALTMGLVLCDESGSVIYRNAQADVLMTSRYGDAIAAQTVTELLAEGWHLGVAERTIDLYGPPRRTLTVRAVVINDTVRPLGVLAMIEDISERRRLEDIRRDFIANVSHELKTPMGAMGLLAETLQFERDPQVAQRLTERIHSEAFRVNRIIEDLLDLSRIESEGSPAREPVSVELVVAEGSDRIRTAADQRGVRVLVTDISAGLVVLGDRRQLVSAIHALSENAVTYSPTGGTVSISAERRDAAGSSFDGPWVRITVSDQGVGIPAKDHERIFERFYRVDPGRARQTGGTGLGLSIVRHVAHNHGGQVSVNSREGEGSTFYLDLPLSLS